MSLWNVARVLHRPYGIIRNSYTPMLPTIKVVYCWDSLAILTCQKPDFRSIVEKNQDPTMDSIVSCICGSGNASFLVWRFSHWKSIQNRSITPRGLGQPDCSPVWHLLDVFRDLFHQWRSYPPEPFLEGLHVQHLNHMLGGIGTPYLVWFQGEDTVVLHKHLLKLQD